MSDDFKLAVVRNENGSFSVWSDDDKLADFIGINAEENARLFVAAPELLHVCRLSLGEFRSHPSTCIIEDVLHRVISKAGG